MQTAFGQIDAQIVYLPVNLWTMPTELDIELEKVHTEIARLLGMDRSNLVFEYANGEDGKTSLHLITYNPRHKQSFLFNTTQGFGELDAVQKMLGYVKDQKLGSNNYTIQWALHGEHELHTSYFRGKNMYEVLDKFYYNKDIAGTVIFSISLNPLS